MITKSGITAFLIIAMILIVGCVNYKAPPKTGADNSLTDEIAAVEKELGVGKIQDKDNSAKQEKVEEEVVLPKLNEKEEKVVNEEGLQTLTVKENQLINLKVNVADPDKDKVTYTFSKPLDANGQWKTNYGDAGEYIVTITATDGKLTTEKRIKLVVQKVNVPPAIESLHDITVKEGEEVSVEPKVSDPNNDPVTVTISEPLNDGNWKTDHKSAGEYNIKVVVTDGELESQASFKLTVIDVNQPPVISGLEDLTVNEGDLVQIKPKVTDEDGDEVKVSISDPVGNDGSWQTTYTDHGEYVVTVTADDGKDKVVKKINLVVEDVNEPPVFEQVSVETQ